jgi:hypothetical protein
MTLGDMIAAGVTIDSHTVTIVGGLACALMLALPFVAMALLERSGRDRGSLRRQAEIYAIAARIATDGRRPASHEERTS